MTPSLDCTRRSNFGPPPRYPTREAVESLAQRIARERDLSTSDIFGRSRRLAAVAARDTTIALIVKETGCSLTGLAEVSGWDRRCIQRSLSRSGVRGAA